MRDHTFRLRPEQNTGECDHFGSARSGSLAVLAGSHGEEKGAADDVSCVQVDIGRGVPTVSKFKELSQEFRCDSSLSGRRGV
jgi:hypothetical protein